MKSYSLETEKLFDWWVTYYERACPIYPEQKPTAEIIRHAAMLSYDDAKSSVPQVFLSELGGLKPKDRRDIALSRIRRWAWTWRSTIEGYMKEEYDVDVIFQTGNGGKGKCIVLNKQTAENINAVKAQAKWDARHCSGTHQREDFNAEQFNRLQPKAAIERHKLVPLSLPKPKERK